MKLPFNNKSDTSTLELESFGESVLLRTSKRLYLLNKEHDIREVSGLWDDTGVTYEKEYFK